LIKPAAPEDTPALVALAAATGVFKPLEVETLEELLGDYHATYRALGHRCAALRGAGGTTVGFSYHAPAAMTDRAWYLYWIAVEPGLQGKGVGAELLNHVEGAVRGVGGRVLLVETSGLAPYEPARRFYLRHGYELVARVPDYYADGDDQVIFRKRFGA
jgi:ribosomal protein S18 acetylase RimI-like enzyme